jgi:hypothetical protein
MVKLPTKLSKLIYSYLPQPKIVDYILNYIKTEKTLNTEDAKNISDNINKLALDLKLMLVTHTISTTRHFTAFSNKIIDYNLNYSIIDTNALLKLLSYFLDILIISGDVANINEIMADLGFNIRIVPIGQPTYTEVTNRYEIVYVKVYKSFIGY